MKFVCIILSIILTIDYFNALLYEIKYNRTTGTPKTEKNIGTPKFILAGIFVIYLWCLTAYSFVLNL